jgi:hypothetical protein
VNESVEQAATVEGWKARAQREAAVIISEARAVPDDFFAYERLLALVAIGWLQGANFGSHDTLGRMDQAFDGLRTVL